MKIPSLASLSSLNATPSNMVHAILIVLLVVLLTVKIPFDLHQMLTSIPSRIVWTIATMVVITNYGIPAGVLSALIMIVLLTDVSIEGMTGKQSNASSKDPVGDALDKVKQNATKNPLPPPTKNTATSAKNVDDNENDNKDEPIETKVANANQVGQMSLVDQDHAMKLSALVNSKSDSVEEQVKQMNKERKQVEQTPVTEGFGLMGVGISDQIKSVFTPFA